MNANSISFFTPVSFGPQKTRTEFVLEKVDSYFYLKGKRAEVLPNFIEQREKDVCLVQGSSSSMATALKVVSYSTVVIPLLLLPVKALMRSQMHFSISEETAEQRLESIENKQRAIETFREKKLLSTAKIERFRKNLLSDSLLEGARDHIDRLERAKTEKDYKLPMAQDGKTNVFLPPSLPIVLKESGKLKSRRRAENMRAVRDLCEANGLSHLIVPKRGIYKGFIIESRLPIPKNCFQEQMEIYSKNRDLFQDAAKEFTKLLFLSEITGVLDKSYDPLTIFGPMGRHDNFALYVEDGEGKVGLVDLERFSPIDKPVFSVDEVMSRCKNAIAIFPYHVEEVIEAAREFTSVINEESKCQRLYNFSYRAQNVFTQVYERHLDFLQRNGIDLKNPWKVVEPSSKRVKKIKEIVLSKILSNHPQSRVMLAFIRHQERLEKRFPKLLSIIADFFFDFVDREEGFSSYGQLMCERVLYLRPESRRRQNLVQDIAEEIEESVLYSQDTEHLARFIIKEIFKEMESGGELAFYDLGEENGVEYIFF